MQYVYYLTTCICNWPSLCENCGHAELSLLWGDSFQCWYTEALWGNIVTNSSTTVYFYFPFGDKQKLQNPRWIWVFGEQFIETSLWEVNAHWISMPSWDIAIHWNMKRYIFFSFFPVSHCEGYPGLCFDKTASHGSTRYSVIKPGAL